LLALVEVETSGNPFEQDGRTPALLYERHIAWRMAAKVSKALQSAFARAGLAIPKWSKATQYKDQGTSAKRLALIGQARALNAEVANQSASWGLGQTMGFLYAELGFASACDMVEHLSGNVAGQIECMIRELRNKHLIEPLNAHEWARVRAATTAPAMPPTVTMCGSPTPGSVGCASSPAALHRARRWPADDVKALQKKLRALGYASVGNPDGRFGTKTIGALSQFQAHEGLPVTGKLDDATREALKTAEPIEAPRERKLGTPASSPRPDRKPSRRPTRARCSPGARARGTVLVGGGAAEKLGLLDHGARRDRQGEPSQGHLGFGRRSRASDVRRPDADRRRPRADRAAVAPISCLRTSRLIASPITTAGRMPARSKRRISHVDVLVCYARRARRLGGGSGRGAVRADTAGLLKSALDFLRSPLGTMLGAIALGLFLYVGLDRRRHPRLAATRAAWRADTIALRTKAEAAAARRRCAPK
jgi:hypothetical protein